MANGKDWIPGTITGYNAWVIFFVPYVLEKCKKPSAAWLHILQGDEERLASLFADYIAKYEVTIKPHTPVDKYARKIAQDELTAFIRVFTDKYLRHPPVTDEERFEMGVTIRSTSTTPNSPPVEMITLKILLRNVRTLLIHYSVTDSTSKARPNNCIGAEIHWLVSDKPAEFVAELTTGHALSTRTPYVYNCDEHDAGKILSVAARWANRRGTGPWSSITTIHVPHPN